MKTIIVTGATYIKAYKVKIEFSDNTFRIIDFGPFLKENPHPQWDKYNNIDHFKKFKIENGNLVWVQGMREILNTSSLQNIPIR